MDLEDLPEFDDDEDLNNAPVWFSVVMIIALIFLGWYCFQESACMDMAKKAQMPYFDYSFGKGCMVGETVPPGLVKGLP